MKQVVPIVLSVEEFELVAGIVMESFEYRRDEYTTEKERDNNKSIYLALLQAAYDVELRDIAERLQAKWTDIDCPKGEYSSSSSPRTLGEMLESIDKTVGLGTLSDE